MWAQREYIVLPVHMCNFDSSSGHHHKGGSEKVIYPEGSQRASQKLYKLQVKKLQDSFRSTWRISSLLFCFPAQRFQVSVRDYPHIRKMKYWSQNLPWVQEKGNFSPSIFNNLGIRSHHYLTATHKHGTHGSMLRVKNNIAVPTRKLPGEFRHK